MLDTGYSMVVSGSLVPSKEGRIPSNRCQIFDFDIDDLEFTNLGLLALRNYPDRLLVFGIFLPEAKKVAPL